ncbi:MAG: holo-[acyl-carrier-protein] synthase [Chloroflexi bacterium]|nr:holo-[acyl-carrier-protein] synthase [Chloroflexota bacterium]
MLSAGVDLIEVKRIEETIARYGNRFLTRVFTARELQSCRGQAQSLAARFAAKEAVSKTLGTGLDGIAWREIEIVADARGKPGVQLIGQAAQRAARMHITHFAISLSHTRAHAIAFVVAE